MCALTAKQKQVCALVGAGETVSAAAKAVNVNPTTVYDWYRDPGAKGRDMAYLTGDYADRFTHSIIGAIVQRALAITLDGEEQNSVKAADVLLKRIQAIETRTAKAAGLALDKKLAEVEAKLGAVKLELAKLELARAKAVREQEVSGQGVALIPVENEAWSAIDADREALEQALDDSPDNYDYLESTAKPAPMLDGVVTDPGTFQDNSSDFGNAGGGQALA